jgi:single-strand DNA-binding protein
MSGFNKVVLIGRLTADAELKYTSNDTAVANFTLAVDRPFTNQQGGKETDFIRIVTWRKQAENVAQYLGKGSMAAIEGRLQIRSYEDRDGNKRTIAEVVADRVVFLDSKKSENTAPDDYDNLDVPF